MLTAYIIIVVSALIYNYHSKKINRVTQACLGQPVNADLAALMYQGQLIKIKAIYPFLVEFCFEGDDRVRYYQNPTEKPWEPFSFRLSSVYCFDQHGMLAEAGLLRFEPLPTLLRV